MDNSLLLVVRNESLDDFRKIARRIRKIDPSIDVLIFGNEINPYQIPDHFLKQPLLTIYLVNPPPEDFKPQAGLLAVKSIGKIKEYEHFKAHNIPCLPIEEFKWGMVLDESIYGDWVVLKPQHIQSTGQDINMVPTAMIPKITLDDFPDNHLIRQDSYFVQKFVRTGARPTHYRANIFLDTVVYSRSNTHRLNYPEYQSDLKILLSQTVASNDHHNREAKLEIDNEMNVFALNVAKTFPSNPFFGVDMIRDDETKEIYVLEVNLGGNIWHFSSEISKKAGFITSDVRKPMILQYNAWDRSAEALVRKTHELAK